MKNLWNVFKRFAASLAIAVAAVGMTGCGERVEVPPASVAKIMSENGYQKNTIGPSKFRLDTCWAGTACDKLIIIDQADKSVSEAMEILMPQDKMIMRVSVQATLSVNPSKVDALFNSVSPDMGKDADQVGEIPWATIYRTYAQQILISESREFLSKYTIGELSSNLGTVTTELRAHLGKVISQRTPFMVRYVGLSNVKYPDVITKAQEGAAQRREQIQTEEAQLQISKVKLERELQEARLTRQIEFEKAQTEAAAFRTQAQSITPEVLKKQELDNQAAWIHKWNGQLPDTVTADIFGAMNQAPRK
jgi:SPFH domain / Band 7 family